MEDERGRGFRKGEMEKFREKEGEYENPMCK